MELRQGFFFKQLAFKLAPFILSLGLGLGLTTVLVQSLSSVQGATRATSVTPYLVKDILTGTTSSNPDELINVNGTLFFVSSDDDHGLELWKSDSTLTGTLMVKDIYTGANSSDPSRLTAVNDTLFFRATDGVHGSELWKSDGTPGGTVMVKDIKAGFDNSWPLELAGINGVLYFSANNGSHGAELWKSDGTLNGTTMITDVAAGLFSSSPKYFTDVGGKIFFQATDGWIGDAHGTELWRTDGTPTSTAMVKDIYPGITSSLPLYLAAVGDTLFFQANDGVHGKELWKSDGTFTGTVLVRDIFTGTEDSAPTRLTNVNGTLFFQADDGVHGEELWKSDGTLTGTVLVKDINPGLPFARPGDLTVVRGTLFFRAGDGWAGETHGYELWKSDGTPTGTAMVKDIYPGVDFTGPSELINVCDTLFFQAHDGVHGYELWKSDGTFTGTVLVHDIYSGTNSSGPDELTGMDGTLFFQADDGVYGTELWALIVAPSLSVDKRVAGADGDTVSLPLGSVVTYTIVLENNGGSTALDVVMSDRLPLGLSFGGWVQRGAATLLLPPIGETIQWGPQEVVPGTIISIRFSATITTAQSFAEKPLTNTVIFTSTNANSGFDDAILTTATAASISVDKHVAGIGGSTANLPLGDVVTYTIILENNGGSPANDVTLTDVLPVGVSFGDWVQRNAATLQLPPVGETIHWGPQNVAAGMGVTIHFTATITTSQSFVGQIISNTAVSALAGVETDSDTAVFNIAPLVNTPPRLSDIADQKTFVNTPAVVSFTIGDLDTPPDNLRLSRASSNTALVPVSQIAFGGSGENRIITITPTTGTTGTTTITITLDDRLDSDDKSFKLTVIMRHIYLPTILKND